MVNIEPKHDQDETLTGGYDIWLPPLYYATRLPTQTSRLSEDSEDNPAPQYMDCISRVQALSRTKGCIRLHRTP